MTIHVTGNTFPHRDLLRAWRGAWDNDAKRWEFRSLSRVQLDTLRGKVGVMVTQADEPPPRVPEITLDDVSPDFIQSILDSLDDDPDPPHIRRGPTAVYGDDERYLNYFKDQNPTAFFGFSSLAKFTDYVAGLHEPRDGRNDGWIGRGKWHGTPDMGAALRLAREGWPEGIAGAAGLDIPHAVARKRRNSMAGGLVNVGRMLSGNPAHMVHRPKLPGRRVTTLFIETFMSAGVDPDNAIARAILVASMADVMEREGYSCEIVAVLTTLDDGSRTTGHQAAITLKQAGERLNLNDIVFALGHPSFFRRMIFAAVGVSDACRSTWRSHGHPSEAFDMFHPTRQNEFYIKQLSLASQRKMTDDPLSMLPFIEPDGLPVKLRNDRG
jgi:hypothetical protein